MEFNVAQLLKQPVGTVREYYLGREEAGYMREVRWVQGRVRFLRVSNGLLATAKMEVQVEMVCSRCLEPMEQVLAFEFQEQYFPLQDVERGLPLPAPEDPAAFTIGQNHVLDLREALRQYTTLAMPMQPICQAECQGLCPQCGANLNQGPCQCPPQIDPRLAALRDLLER
jgi:uncharacterized protein